MIWLGQFVGRVGIGYRLCLIGDMNGWVGDRVIEEWLILVLKDGCLH